MTTFDEHRNLALSTVSAGSGVIDSASGTTLVAASDAEAAEFPAVPFFVTVWRDQTPIQPAVEIMRASAFDGAKTFTVEREQQGTVAQLFISQGWKFGNTITVADIVAIEDAVTGGEAGLAAETAARESADATLQSNITAEATARVAGDAATLVSAETYADAHDATTLAAAETYADGKVAAEASSRVAGDAATLASAEGYSDTHVAAEATARVAGDAATLASSEGYTDAEIASEAALRVSGDAATLAAAEAYSDSGLSAKTLASLADVHLTGIQNKKIIWYDPIQDLWSSISAEALTGWDILVATDGATVTAYSRDGDTLASGVDAGAVMNALAIPASGCGIKFRNDGFSFAWTSPWFVPVNLTGWLDVDFGMARHVLAGGNKGQFVAPNRAADYDTWRYIYFRRGVFDLTGATGSVNVFGTQTAAGQLMRMNFYTLGFEDLFFVNVPQHGTSDTVGIGLSMLQAAAGEATQNTAKRIWIRNCEMDGGVTLALIAGSSLAALASGPSLNTFVDQVWVTNWRHDTGFITATRYSAAHIQIGGLGQAGFIYVSKGYGRGSGDVGVEIDCPSLAVVEDCTIEDPVNYSFLAVNFATPINPGSNRWIWERCHHRKIAQTALSTKGFRGSINTTVNIPLGEIVISDCSASKRTTDLGTEDGWAIHMIYNASAGISRVVIDEFLCEEDGIVVSSGSPIGRAISISSGTTPCVADLSNIRFKVTGDLTGASGGNWNGIAFESGTIKGRVRYVTFDVSLTGAQPATIQPITVGISGGAALTFDGSFRELYMASLAGDSSARGIVVRGTNLVTIPAKKFISITDSDLAACSATNEVVLVADGAAQTKVFCKRNIYNTTNGQKAPTSFTGLATGVGKALGVLEDSFVEIQAGSGTGITVIEVSTNGGTNYTTLLSQASGAVPAGYNHLIGPFRGDTLLRVTFTGTQPTMQLVPAG